MQTLKLEIEGWTCGGCVKGTQRAVGKVDGVHSAEGDLEARTLTVSLEAGEAVAAAVKAAVEKAGYAVISERTEES